MKNIYTLLSVCLKGALRDRVLHAVLGIALLLFLLVPALSLFSMRQVQQMAITLSLSVISVVLLVVTTMLGGFSVWRDVERRYTASVMGLPVSRSGYLLGKFTGIATVLFVTAGLLAIVSAGGIFFASTLYPSELPILWENMLVAIVADFCKYTLLSSIALLFSSLSTSFFLPVFGTLAIYLAGNASQGVMEYVSGDYGRTLSFSTKMIVQGLYYVLPNFSAFNFKVQAVYALPLSLEGMCLTFLYFLIYLSVVLSISVWIFGRRELP